MCSPVLAAGIPSLSTIFHQYTVVISFITDLQKYCLSISYHTGVMFYFCLSLLLVLYNLSHLPCL